MKYAFTRSIWEVIKFYNVGDKSFETLITMGSFKESKFKLTCCAGQGLITIEVVMQKLKKLKILIVDTFSPGLTLTLYINQFD